MKRSLIILLGFLVGHLPDQARSATKLCVEVRSEEKEVKNLRKLVLDELAHHPTHIRVDQVCDSVLKVEMFTVKGVHYLTARINQEVPVRHAFKDLEELDEKLSDALRQVLAHDPVYLADDITHYSAIKRAAHSILKRGNNIWRVEMFQGIARGGSNAAFSPGAAVTITRGADHWQVFTRIYFGGWPGEIADGQTVLRVNTGADAGLTYEFSRLGNTSLYASLGAGLHYLRYEDSIDVRNDFGPTLHARVGIRFLRIHDFDCDLFVAGYLPLHGADVDTRLDDFYPLGLQAGLGVGF